jgi:hypothetical protein
MRACREGSALDRLLSCANVDGGLSLADIVRFMEQHCGPSSCTRNQLRGAVLLVHSWLSAQHFGSASPALQFVIACRALGLLRVEVVTSNAALAARQAGNLGKLSRPLIKQHARCAVQMQA